MKHGFILLLIFFSLASPAGAARIDDKGAQKLRVIFETMMAERKSLIESDGATKLFYDGTAMVEPEKKYYAVTLPHSKIIYSDGDQFEIGMISINASPGEEDGQWKMTIALPTPITLNGVHGSVQTKINIGEQKAAGIWDEGLQGFSSLDADYKNIVIENYAVPYTVRVPRLRLHYNLARDETGFWSGPGEISVERLSLTMPPISLQGHVESLTASFTLDHYNPHAVRTYRQHIRDVVEKAGPGEDGNSSLQFKDIAGPLFDFLTRSGRGAEAAYTVSDVSFSWQGKDKSSPGFFVLDNARIGAASQGLDGNQASLNVFFDMKGLDTQGGAQGRPYPLLPSHAHIDWKAENIPIQQIAEVANNTMTAVKDSNMAPLAGLTLMIKIPALLSQSGAKLSVLANSFGTDDYSVLMDGFAKADITAANSATAEAHIIVSGLEHMIETARKAAKSPQAEEAEAGRQLAEQLEMIKKYAREQPQPGESPKYAVDFVMDGKGQMLMNGRPLSSVVFKQ